MEARKAEISRLSEVAEREESAQRSMEAQQRVLCEAEGRAGNEVKTVIDTDSHD